MVPPRRIELPTPPLPIEYFLTIMNKNRQKLVLLGNAKLRFTVKKIKKACNFCKSFLVRVNVIKLG